MEACLSFRHANATPMPTAMLPTSQIPSVSQQILRIKRIVRLRVKAKPHDEDSIFNAAMYRTSLRFLETLASDPLFVDPYVECLVRPGGVGMDVKRQGLHQHCVGTKFIDDKLLHVMTADEGLRQVVLLTDGMDTRPYRINWPPSTVIFDVSPDPMFTNSSQKLQDVGAKIPRSCLFLHVPSATSNIEQALRSKGFKGGRSSLWVLQGLPILTLTDFKDILVAVSNLAMKGCLFIGELPVWLAETDIEFKSETARWMDKLFMSHGLRVEIIEYDEIVRNPGKELIVDDYKNALFVAEQLQFSDDQMDTWRREFQRMEEEGDEDGFEEL